MARTLLTRASSHRERRRIIYRLDDARAFTKGQGAASRDTGLPSLAVVA